MDPTSRIQTAALPGSTQGIRGIDLGEVVILDVDARPTEPPETWAFQIALEVGS